MVSDAWLLLRRRKINICGEARGPGESVGSMAPSIVVGMIVVGNDL